MRTLGTALVLLAAAIAPAQADTTNVLTIFGQALVGEDIPAAGLVLKLSIVHGDDTEDVREYTFTGSDLGLFALAFVDFDGDNVVAADGDRVDAELRDALGDPLGTAQGLVSQAAVETHLLRLDITAIANATDGTTWGRIKALYQ